MNRVTALLGSQHPIIQGAMGVISNPELVAAVSESGGFGVLATVFAKDADVVRQQVQETKKLTNQPFGANLQVMNPLSIEFAEVLAQEGIGVVTLSGGSPKSLIPLLHEKGIKAIPVVPNVAIAKKVEAAGADALVAEGSESGGIQGFKGASTMVLVPAIADAVNIPVIAAGGIADSRGYKAALALGAEGVQIGTRFIAAKECIAHINYKNLVVDRTETGTDVLNLGAFQVRTLRTPLTEKMVSGELQPGEGLSGSGVEESWLLGDLEAGTLPAGEVSGLIHSVLTVKEIMEDLLK